MFSELSSRLAAHWLNAHDVHSGLSHFRFFAGTTPGGQDIFPSTRLHLVDKISVTSPSPLPLGIPLFITVEAFDFAGTNEYGYLVVQHLFCWECSHVSCHYLSTR